MSGTGPELAARPGPEEFRALAEDYAVVPVWCEMVADTLTPVGAFLQLVGDRPGFLLESVEGGERWGRYSFVGRSALGTIVRDRSGVRVEGDVALPQEVSGVLDALRSVLAAYRSPSVPGLPPLHGGLVGYLGYDVVREIERLPAVPPDDLGFPDAALAVIGQLAAFDHWGQRVLLVDNVIVPEDRDPKALESARAEAVRRLGEMAAECCRPLGTVPAAVPEKGAELAAARRTMTSESYRLAVEAAKEYIYAGDIFQVVLSQRFDLELGAHPFDVYRALRLLNPSPYLYFLRFPEVVVVGSSPEPMVRLRDGLVTSRPIAGSRPRGATEEDDRRLAGELSEDPKELAEHVMLVDLARNDVGRVARFGTERVEELMTVERYSHIMHLTSQVSGELAPGRDPVDVLRATLPAGTLSGAPKVRAMEIIDELEPTKRGIYGGIVGYFDFSGNLDTAIAIRTLVTTPDGRATVQAGAGIVADSDPASEDAECAHKAAALLAAVAAARQLTAAREEAGSAPAHAAVAPGAADLEPGPGWGEDDLEDYRALRQGVASRELQRDFVRVSGPESATYLQGQCSQDVAALRDGEAAESLLLAPDGHLDALVRVLRLGDEEFVVDVDGGFGDAVVERLSRFKLRTRATIEALDWTCLALRGPGVDGVRVNGGRVDVASPATGTAAALPVDWPGWSGVDLVGPDPAPGAAEGLRSCGPTAWQARRIEVGLPEMGTELDAKTIPAEADLVARAVSFTKGCYTGQELVARLDARGNRVPRRLRGLVLDVAARPTPPLGTEPLVGAMLQDPGNGKSVGRITSAAWSPALGRPVALAYVHRSVEVPGQVSVVGGGSVVELPDPSDLAEQAPEPEPGQVPVIGRAEVRELPLVGES